MSAGQSKRRRAAVGCVLHSVVWSGVVWCGVMDIANEMVIFIRSQLIAFVQRGIVVRCCFNVFDLGPSFSASIAAMAGSWDPSLQQMKRESVLTEGEVEAVLFWLIHYANRTPPHLSQSFLFDEEIAYVLQGPKGDVPVSIQYFFYLEGPLKGAWADIVDEEVWWSADTSSVQ